MKRNGIILFICLLFAACSNNEPSNSKDLSVKGHTYYGEGTITISDSQMTFSSKVKFDNTSCYLNDEFAGTYTQENEVVKVNKIEDYSGTTAILNMDRVYISYGDYITFNGMVLNKIE